MWAREAETLAKYTVQILLQSTPSYKIISSSTTTHISIASCYQQPVVFLKFYLHQHMPNETTPMGTKFGSKGIRDNYVQCSQLAPPLGNTFSSYTKFLDDMRWVRRASTISNGFSLFCFSLQWILQRRTLQRGCDFRLFCFEVRVNCVYTCTMKHYTTLGCIQIAVGGKVGKVCDAKEIYHTLELLSWFLSFQYVLLLNKVPYMCKNYYWIHFVSKGIFNANWIFFNLPHKLTKLNPIRVGRRFHNNHV